MNFLAKSYGALRTREQEVEANVACGNENMARVVIHTTMSLDGFIARPNDDISWAFDYGTDETIADVMKEIGAIVVGNRGFKEGKVNENALPYGGTVKVPHFVVT